MSELKKFLLYGGLDRKSYKNIRARESEENRKTVRIFTALGASAFVFAALASIMSNMNMPLNLYFIGAGAFLIMMLLNELLAKKLPAVSDFFAIVYSATLLIAGVLIAYSQIDERTTMLLLLFTLVSLVFCFRPVYMVSILTGAELMFIIIMRPSQSADLYFVNAVNTGIFYFIGLCGGFYSLTMKYKKYEAEYENRILTERDELTGLFNRYSCKMEFDKIIKNKVPVTICSFDINGLKRTNDTKGHLAGDELVIGAAECISDVFGKYGNVYRIGGDEFCVLIYKDFDEAALRSEFSERMKKWRGKLSDEMNIALGMAKLERNFDTETASVVHTADLQMYAEKRAYYESRNVKNSQ